MSEGQSGRSKKFYSLGIFIILRKILRSLSVFVSRSLNGVLLRLDATFYEAVDVKPKGVTPSGPWQESH